MYKRQTVILVVEDEFLIRSHLAGILADAGHVAIATASADEAIAVLESRSDIRIIITDIEMPGSMDGLRLAAAVRNRWPPIDIIITTGNAAPPADSMPAGSRFLGKPYAPADVLSALRQLN